MSTVETVRPESGCLEKAPELEVDRTHDRAGSSQVVGVVIRRAGSKTRSPEETDKNAGSKSQERYPEIPTAGFAPAARTRVFDLCLDRRRKEKKNRQLRTKQKRKTK